MFPRAFYGGVGLLLVALFATLIYFSLPPGPSNTVSVSFSPLPERVEMDRFYGRTVNMTNDYADSKTITLRLDVSSPGLAFSVGGEMLPNNLTSWWYQRTIIRGSISFEIHLRGLPRLGEEGSEITVSLLYDVDGSGYVLQGDYEVVLGSYDKGGCALSVTEASNPTTPATVLTEEELTLFPTLSEAITKYLEEGRLWWVATFKTDCASTYDYIVSGTGGTYVQYLDTIFLVQFIEE